MPSAKSTTSSPNQTRHDPVARQLGSYATPAKGVVAKSSTSTSTAKRGSPDSSGGSSAPSSSLQSRKKAKASVTVDQLTTIIANAPDLPETPMMVRRVSSEIAAATKGSKSLSLLSSPMDVIVEEQPEATKTKAKSASNTKRPNKNNSATTSSRKEVPRVSPNKTPTAARRTPPPRASDAKRDAAISAKGGSSSRLAANSTATAAATTSNKTGERLVKECDENVVKLQSLLNGLSTFPVRRRHSTTTTTPLLLLPYEQQESQQLVTEQRAAQEFIAKRAVRVAINMVRSLKANPTRSVQSELRSFLEECTQDLDLVRRDLMRQQEMQAESLVARLRVTSFGQDVPDIPVVFSFSREFQQALQLFPN